MDLLTEILVPEGPSQGAWMALKKDKSVFVEGKDGWWSKELAKEVEQVFVMGLTLPKCDRFDFFREALAHPGDTSPKPSALVFKGYLDALDLTLTYRFKVVSPEMKNKGAA